MAGCFISYAREDDEPFAEALCHDLRTRGIDVWWDRRSMESRGRTFLQEIRDAIAGSERFLLVVGPAAVTSDYVTAEWRTALEYCRAVVPVLRFGDYDLLPAELAAFHGVDFRASRSGEEALQELLRILATPVPEPGTLHGVEQLPTRYIQRTADLATLSDLVLADVNRPTVVVSAEKTAGVAGMGGIGKSVLAAAFCRSCETRRAFVDGIVWLKFREDPDVLGHLTLVGRCIGNLGTSAYPDIRTAAARLSEVLKDKRCLLVLDDVRQIEHAESFPDILGPRCRLLITTRDASITASLGASALSLDVLSVPASLALLARWAGCDVTELPDIARDLVAECGCLPFALAIVGAMARTDMNRWEGALHHLRNADLGRLAKRFPNYPYPNILRAIEASVDRLPPSIRTRYLELGIFTEGVAVPEATLGLYWQAVGLDVHDTREIVDLLVDRSLLRRTQDGEVTLHDLHFDYARTMLGEQQPFHARLVEAYRAACNGRWDAGPEDGYFHLMLPRHMAGAGQHEELASLLTDPEWIARKLRVEGMQQVLRDYRLERATVATDVVHRALDLSTAALSGDRPAELHGQLLGRLTDFGDPAMARLRTKLLARTERPRLLPAYACLTPVGGPLLATLSGHRGRVNALATSTDSRTVVSGGADHRIIVWDVDNREARHVLVGHEDEVNAVHVIDRKGLVISGAGFAKPFKMHREFAQTIERMELRPSADNSIRGWDLTTGEQRFRLDGHDGAVRSVVALPDGEHLFSSGDDGTIRLWTIDPPGEVGILDRRETPVIALHLMPRLGSLLAVTELDLPMYSLVKPQAPGAITFDRHWHNVLAVDTDAFVLALQWETFDGYFFILQTWDIPNSTDGNELLRDLWKFQHVPICTGAFYQNGRRLVVGLADNTARVFDIPGRAQRSVLEGHGGEVTAVAGTANDRFIVTGSEDATVRVWNADEGVPEPRPPHHEQPVVAIRVTPDCQFAVSGSEDGSVKVTRLADGSIVDTLHQPSGGLSPVFDPVNGVRSLDICPDGRSVACLHARGEVTVYAIDDRRVLSTFNANDGGAREIAAERTGNRLAATYGRKVHVWDLDSPKDPPRSIELEAGATAVAFVPRTDTVLLAEESGRIASWDVTNGRCLGQLASPPPHKSLIEGSEPIWRVRRRPGDIPTAVAPRPIALAFAVDPVCNRAFAAHQDGAITEWDLQTFQRQRSVQAHEGIILGLSIDPQGRFLASASDDRRVRLWDTTTLDLIAEFVFDQAAYCVDIGRDGRTMAVGSGGPTGRVACLGLHDA